MARVSMPPALPGKLPPALPGFVQAKPMLFATLYPLDSGDFDELRKGVSKLVLNDASVRRRPCLLVCVVAQLGRSKPWFIGASPPFLWPIRYCSVLARFFLVIPSYFFFAF